MTTTIDAGDITLDAILEQMPMSMFHYRLLTLCGLVFMADAMEVNLLTYISTCAGDEWGLSDSQRASIISAVFAGEMCGSVFWGPFTDKFGRRIGFLSASIVICTAGFLSALSPSYGWLLFFRMVAGFGVGGGYVPYDLLSEYLPAGHRGDYLTRMQYFWTVGSLFVTGLAWATLSQQGWRFLTYMTAVPVTLSCIFALYCLPESPRWLLVKGRVDEAIEEIEKLAAMCHVELRSLRASSDFSPPKSPSPDYFGESDGSGSLYKQTMITGHRTSDESGSHHVGAKDPSYLDVFATKAARKLMLPLSLTWGLFGFTYYGIILYIGRLYHNEQSSGNSAHGSCSFDYESMFINTSGELLGSFLCIVLVDRIGRINTQVCLYFCGGIAIALMCISMPKSAALVIIFLARMNIMGASVSYVFRRRCLLVIHTLLICVCQQNATWVATPEVLPTEMRATGHAWCNTMTRIGGFLTPFFVDNKNYSLPVVGVVLGIMNICAG
jgi:MFS family permease